MLGFQDVNSAPDLSMAPAQLRAQTTHLSNKLNKLSLFQCERMQCFASLQNSDVLLSFYSAKILLFDFKQMLRIWMY